jgi:hypothetical protein
MKLHFRPNIAAVLLAAKIAKVTNSLQKESETKEGKATGEVCEECENAIPSGTGSIANRHHADTCSLFDPKED